ncbi:hypothetical protein BJX99DRAFT_190369 [Aspergillus californicus]
MLGQSHSATRKGTKSCTECRRRKVRCVRMPDDAPICRQCTERNTTCLAQTSSPRPRQTHRLPSRYRIAQLESQVNRLTKIVSGFEGHLGGQSSIPPDNKADTPGSENSDAESSASEILIAEEPSQIRSLFQNDWLSVDTRRQDEHRQERREKASAHLLESVRPALQKLIPSKEEMGDMMICTYDWLQMIHSMLPQPSVPSSHQELLQRYEEMCGPDVDVVALASWLLTLAITAQQVSQQGHRTDAEATNAQRRIHFSRVVSDVVESMVMTHDRLVGTLPGLGMSIHFIRLQMGRGNPQRAWLKLRHVVAIAELMGLPKAAQLARIKKSNGTIDEVVQNEKVQLWDLICTIDRLAGMLINLPPYTRRYPLITPSTITIDGVVQTSVYIRRLVDITPKIHDMEELSATQGSTTKLYTSALEIAREARELASQTPKSWWIISMADELRPDHIVQFIHYAIVMKAHLPVAIRQDHSEEYLYSRLACMDACESVANRYQFLRRKLPSGFFTLRLLDLQVFTAMVLLLLTSHNCPSLDRRSFQIDKVRLEGVVAQVINLMEEKSKDGVGSDFAERGAKTIRALRDLLQQDDANIARVQELTVNVPLMGKIHIRRNLPTQAARPSTQPVTNVAAQSGNWNAAEQMNAAGYNSQLNTSTYITDPLMVGQGEPDMQWDHLSWSVEDTTDNLFDDALMAETFDQSTWQNAYYTTPFT